MPLDCILGRNRPSQPIVAMMLWNALCEHTQWVAYDKIDDKFADMAWAAESSIAAAFPGQNCDEMMWRLLLFAAFARPHPPALSWNAHRVLSPVQLRRLIRAYKRENGPDHAIA